MSISKRLLVLTFVLCLSLSLAGAIGFGGITKVSHQLATAINVQFPAIRQMTMLDMMHDGIRASAYSAVINAQFHDQKQVEDAAKELDEMAENSLKYIGDLKSLPLSAESKKAVEDIEPAFKNYIEQAKGVVALAKSGQLGEAKAPIKAFQETFEDMETRLDHAADPIKKEAGQVENEGEKARSLTMAVTAALVLLSLALGVFFSRWILRDLQRFFSSVESEASGLSDVVNSLKSTAEMAQERAQTQTEALTQTSSVIVEIQSMVERNAKSSDNSYRVAEEGRVSASGMLDKIEGLKQAVSNIEKTNHNVRDQVDHVNARMEELTAVITEIGQKTKIINDIVFQTKLLSFNASVEAARAGEQGKGFAVVAQEVGALAQSSGVAAAEISKILNESIAQVTSATRQMRDDIEKIMSESQQRISAGSQIAQECDADLETLSTKITDVANLSRDVSSASKEQEIGVRSIQKAIRELDEICEKNRSAAVVTSQAAEELDRRYQQFNDVFRDANSLFGRKPQSAA